MMSSPRFREEAKRRNQLATQTYKSGQFELALQQYQSAYDLYPDPAFLFNIAQCYRNLGDQERARFFFRRYLALDPHAPNKRRVEELIDEMTKQLEAKQAEGAATPPAATPPPVEPPTAPVAPLASWSRSLRLFCDGNDDWTCAETLFMDYHRQHGIAVKVARIFNTYGPRMHPNDGRVVSNFLVQALSGVNSYSVSGEELVLRQPDNSRLELTGRS